MYGYFCIGFAYFMLKGKSLLDYTYSFSPNEYDNEKIILCGLYCVVISYRNLKHLKYHTFQKIISSFYYLE